MAALVEGSRSHGPANCRRLAAHARAAGLPLATHDDASPAHVADAWRLHARLVRRHLERGIYQGWDLHPAQLVTRFLATYAFYRDGFPAAATRLRNYVHRIDSAILDEPATARALASFIHRGVTCGAVTAAEVASAAEVTVETVRDLALNRPTTIQPEETR